ncbi:DUF7224 domain-containing protein [Streptomyces sp. 8N706]|uniref:DUF7224 domain-containing protein n=1 Tax=Streptomyces sp. 8N706 TaxID=3457416 RepID=UPI003FD4A459
MLLLTLFYYFAGESAPLAVFHGYAPALVAAPLMTLYALAYAVAAALASWESGRLTSSGVWALAPARSRFRVAANVLLPVILLSWLVLLLPPSLSLVRTGTLPTAGSLRLPVMALVLCVAHAVIGFGIGIRAPRMITAPLMAITVWVLVAFSRATQPYWLRHVSGQYADLDFGEVPAVASLVAPLLFGGGIAIGVALLWLPLRGLAARAVLACAVSGICTVSAYNVAHEWDHNPPLATGQAPMECQGNAPKVCMPKATSSNLAAVRKEVVSVLDALRSSGVKETPSVITDRLADGRFARPSTKDTWRIGLTSAAQRDDVRFQVVTAAVRFPCKRADAVTGHAALLWAATVTDQVKPYNERMAQEMQTPETARAEKQVRDIVQGVLELPVKKQGVWFRQSLSSACHPGKP